MASLNSEGMVAVKMWKSKTVLNDLFSVVFVKLPEVHTCLCFISILFIFCVQYCTPFFITPFEVATQDYLQY